MLFRVWAWVFPSTDGRRRSNFEFCFVLAHRLRRISPSQCWQCAVVYGPTFGISPAWRSPLRCGRRRVEARTAWYGQTAGGSPGVSPRGQSCRSRTWWSRYRQGIVRGCWVSAKRLKSDKLGTYWFFMHLQIFARFITPFPCFLSQLYSPSNFLPSGQLKTPVPCIWFENHSPL